MKRPHRVWIYGDDPQCGMASRFLLRRGFQCGYAETMEELHHRLVQEEASLAVIAKSGAAGMEAVYLIRQVRGDLPVFWFSDDPNFCLQSHRLECEYFSAFPVTEEKLDHAFGRCAHVGIQFPDSKM